jgi:four helix bundle protein
MNAFVSAHKNLEVWKAALALAEATYRMTRAFPSEERFGLAAQMRRAAVSVLSNISEGAARRTRAEYVHFLHIARGSLAELDAQLALVSRLGYASNESQMLEEILLVGRLLNGQLTALRRGLDARR